jgi:large subunit ribosomal protein L2
MKVYRPKTPGRRGMTKANTSQLTKKVGPFKKLLKTKKTRSGRSKQGRITVRHKGGGHKRKYRIIDFKRVDKLNIPARVNSIEYDPNRSAFIALIVYKDGDKRYILAPQDLKVGDEVIISEKTPLTPGNRMFLKNIPIGSFVYNIELISGQGGKIVRSAGDSAQLMAIEGGHAHLTLPSGEVRMVPEKAMASVGVLSNPEHGFVKLGKAGRSRWLGVRPTVRGSAMNPVDHPHGGGEGRAPVGLRKGPKTPWGKKAFGVKTRKKKKYSDKFILKKRKKKKRK